MQRQVVFAAWRTNLTREQIEGTVLHGEQAAGGRQWVDTVTPTITMKTDDASPKRTNPKPMHFVVASIDDLGRYNVCPWRNPEQ